MDAATVLLIFKIAITSQCCVLMLQTIWRLLTRNRKHSFVTWEIFGDASKFILLAMPAQALLLVVVLALLPNQPKSPTYQDRAYQNQQYPAYGISTCVAGDFEADSHSLLIGMIDPFPESYHEGSDGQKQKGLPQKRIIAERDNCPKSDQRKDSQCPIPLICGERVFQVHGVAPVTDTSSLARVRIWCRESA